MADTEATIWVETDRACQVKALGHQVRTFKVNGHRYALLVLDGLRPGTEYEYRVALDGTVRWPEPDSEFPPSVLRTDNPGQPFRLAFGSCRIAELPVPRYRRSSRRARRRALADDQEHGPPGTSAVSAVYQAVCSPFYDVRRLAPAGCVRSRSQLTIRRPGP